MAASRPRLTLCALEDRTAPAAGTMDTSFGGGDGIARFNLPGFFTVDARAVAVQPDGKTVLAGLADSPTSNHAIVYRLNVDGSLDNSFSGDGFTTSQFGGTRANFSGLAVQPDGKIVATGAVLNGQYTIVTARFNADGSPDLSFGTDGFVTTNFSAQEEVGHRALVQPDGKVVVVGNANGIAFLLRYTAAGALDPTFSLDGVFQFQTGGGGAFFRGAALQPDGKIVAAGHGSPTGSPARGFLLVRVNADGTLDTSFDADGSTVTLIPGTGYAEGYDVAVLPDGRLAAVGAGEVSGMGQHVVARYLADGSLDTTFDGDGRVLLQYQPDAQGGVLHAVAADQSGRIVAAGYSAFPHDGVVLRFREDGTPDPDFGVGNFRLKPGVVFTHAGGWEEVYDLAVLPNGRIVTAGRSDGNVVAIRYNGDNSIAASDSYTATEDAPLSVAAPGVMTNDVIQSGASPQATLVQGPAHGTLTLNADGSFTYTPAANYNGPDSFKYKLVEGGFSSNTVTVSLAVQPANDPPVAGNEAYGYRFHSPLTVSAADGVLKNDTDIDGDPLRAILVAQPAQGSVTLNEDGSFVFTHPEGMTGTVSFTYKVNDGTTDGTTATVTLTRAPNAPPAAADDAYELPFAAPLEVSAAAGVLANDSDADGQPFTAVLVGPPAVGTLTFRADGSFTYAFPPDLVGSVTFTYKATDGRDEGNTATVTLARENLINVTGRTLTVLGSGGPDVVRVVPARLGAVRVGILSAAGMTWELVRPAPLPVSRVEVLLGPGDDRLAAVAGTIPVKVVGGPGGDVIRTGRGADAVFGDDEAGTGTGNDVIDAGAGADTVSGGGGDNWIRTGAGADAITAGDGRQTIDSGPGHDTVAAGTGGSVIDSGAGNDQVSVGGGANWVQGGAGNDVLVGGAGVDALFGEGGKDLLAGGPGNDLLDGGSGNDILFDGRVTVTNPATDSLAKVLAAYVPRRPVLAGLTGRLSVTPDEAGADRLFGGPGTDWFWSNGGLDVLDRRPTEPLNAAGAG